MEENEVLDVNILIDELIGIETIAWELIFFNEPKAKVRTFNLYDVKFQDINSTVKEILEYTKNCKTIDKKTEPYTPYCETQLMIDCWTYVHRDDPVERVYNLFNADRRPFDKSVPKLTGYCFKGKDMESGENYILLKKGEVSKNYRTHYFSFNKDEIREVKDKLYSISAYIDCIFTDTCCYFINDTIPKFLNVDTYTMRKAKQKISYMENNGLSSFIADVESFKNVASMPSMAKPFLSFSQPRFEKLSSLPTEERRKFFSQHNIHYDENGKCDAEDRKGLETLIAFLCEQTARDYYEDTILEGHNLKKIKKEPNATSST